MKCAIVLLSLFICSALCQSATKKPLICKGTDFDCGSRCIPRHFVCDGHFDCPTGNDEDGCKEIRSTTEEIPIESERDVPVFDIEVGKPKDITKPQRTAPKPAKPLN